MSYGSCDSQLILRLWPFQPTGYNDTYGSRAVSRTSSRESILKIVKIILAAAVLAQQLPVAADSGIDSVDPDVRKELTALVEAWIDAEVQSDRSALEEILHEDFLSTFASGTTLDRTSYIDFIVGLDISPFKVRNESMVQHGDTVVVVDISESGTTKFTWIAVSRDGQWKVVSQTFSRVEASPVE